MSTMMLIHHAKAKYKSLTPKDGEDDSGPDSHPSVSTLHGWEDLAGTGSDGFSIYLSAKFLLYTLLFVIIFAFSTGIACRNILLHPQSHLNSASNTLPPTDANQGDMTMKMQIDLPAMKGKNRSSITFTATVLRSEEAPARHTVHYLDVAAVSDPEEKDIGPSSDDEEVDEEDLAEEVRHQPSGQHVLVDIKDVDANFLNSKERLAQAMLDLIEESKVTLLSYHCHSYVPFRVSCVGVALESHISIHTWPHEGIIILDLFTCGTKPLIPILPTIEKLFAVRREAIPGEIDEKAPEPRMIWSHKLRGFRDGFGPYNRYQNPLDQELGSDVLSRRDLDLKVSLLSEETDFQHVDIIELIDPRAHYLGSTPDKILFLDGVQQSTLYGEAEYHEALVHPAMITHPNPKRVAIIGGGEGATLREVLKHNTVDEVIMVEIDGELVEICKDFLPEWNNCSDIVGSDAESCFDDSKATVVYGDAFGWFIDKFGNKTEDYEKEKFDVIIMDALDPDVFVEIVGSLYKDNVFVESLFAGLTEEGVFVVQLGEADQMDEPSLETGPSRDTAQMVKGLSEAGFQSMLVYDEGHSHFYAPWDYLVCFKNSKSRANWHRTAAEIETELHRRLYRTRSGKPALLFFDGSTMNSYQVPSKVTEVIYCRNEITPWECKKYPEGDTFLDEVQGGFNERPVYSPVFERHPQRNLHMENGSETNFELLPGILSSNNTMVRNAIERKRQ